jgi:hypothetical protein
MNRKGSGWYCERGRTGISRMVVDMIIEAMAQIPSAPLREIPANDPSLFGFCPRCGQRFLTTSHATRVCPSCSLSLQGGLFYSLQEHHAHKSVETDERAV